MSGENTALISLCFTTSQHLLNTSPKKMPLTFGTDVISVFAYRSDHYYHIIKEASFCTLFPEKKQGARVDNGLWRDGEKFESGREKMNVRLSTLTSCLSSITISDEILFSRDISPILAFYLTLSQRVLSFLVSSFSIATFTLHIYLNCVCGISVGRVQYLFDINKNNSTIISKPTTTTKIIDKQTNKQTN